MSSTELIWFNKNLYVEVRPVEVGELLEDTDLYQSSSGEWLPCPCPGVENRGLIPFYRPVDWGGPMAA